LTFIDKLEKQIYKAWGASAYNQSSPLLKNSAVFFRANAKVCEDWFFRIRNSIMMATALCNSTTDTIRHATQVCSTFNFSILILGLQRIYDLRYVAQAGHLKDTKKPMNTDLEICVIQLGMNIMQFQIVIICSNWAAQLEGK
jgi:hypothetical protein